jgi:hypothetical protein
MERFEYSDIDTKRQIEYYILAKKMSYEEYVNYMIRADCWKVIVLPIESGDEKTETNPFEEDVLFDGKESRPYGYITIYNLYKCNLKDKNFRHGKICKDEEEKRANFVKNTNILGTYKEVRLYMFCDLGYVSIIYGGDKTRNLRIYNKET